MGERVGEKKGMTRTAAILLFLVGTQAAAQKYDLENPESVPLGVYYCVTDRIVGIQDDKKPNRGRYGGRIVVDDKWKKFTVKTSKIRPTPADCRSKLSKSSLRLRGRDLWFHCDAAYQAEFDQSVSMVSMRGDVSNFFEGMLWEHFSIFVGGSFMMFRGDGGGWYLLEGRCQTF
jgi:hypothetical protein